MKYQVIYYNADDDVCETVVDVPDYIPCYDPLDIKDVPLYIKAQIEDLEFLEDYSQMEAAE